ncbi:MAG: hypothetical protein OXF67_03960 [Cyanobacteria bacterium MAG CAR4_bin_6]|nr:hypothetical protein [Cyanobacteria bacterium MAG CAR4_bin_6]
MTTALVGADWRTEHWQAGAALSTPGATAPMQERGRTVVTGRSVAP